MGATKSIDLVSPVPFGDTRVTRLTFRSPKFFEYMELGEPSSEGMTRDGLYFRNVNTPVVGEYAEKLLMQPDNPHVLRLIDNIVDIRAINEVILGFFAPEPKGEPKTSSSGSDGTPPASGE